MTVTTAIDSSAARRAMIDSQLRVSGVNQEAVLAAMSAVAREDFVPASARGHAYIDRAIPLGDGHALPAPLVHGKMLAEAAPQPGERVLVVSCGSNYLPALVEAMGASVEVASAAEAAAGKPGSVGFTLLLIDGAIEHLPAALVAALADGGRVVTGLTRRGVTSLAKGTKAGGAVQLVPLADIGIPVLAHFAAPKSWSF
ncbi:MAG: protein-L-isoaspartate O-methyltransferase [Novosphingobium sp.]|nr:protein-L-isoaspartate O-methyltransferase [Novosphingobium sp.]